MKKIYSWFMLFIFKDFLLDSLPWSKESCEFMSICSVSGGFLGIDPLVETQHGVRGQCGVVYHSQMFWGKSPLGKND